MRKFVILTALALVFAACSNQDAAMESAQDTGVDGNRNLGASASEPVDRSYTRISFESGAVSAQVPGNLAGFDDENEYVIDVAKGQVMSIKKSVEDEDRISLQIFSPLGENITDMDAGCNGNKTVNIEMSGDYAILVTQCMKADPWNNDYILDVTVK